MQEEGGATHELAATPHALPPHARRLCGVRACPSHSSSSAVVSLFPQPPEEFLEHDGRVEEELLEDQTEAAFGAGSVFWVGDLRKPRESMKRNTTCAEDGVVAEMLLHKSGLDWHRTRAFNRRDREPRDGPGSLLGRSPGSLARKADRSDIALPASPNGNPPHGGNVVVMEHAGSAGEVWHPRRPKPQRLQEGALVQHFWAQVTSSTALGGKNSKNAAGIREEDEMGGRPRMSHKSTLRGHATLIQTRAICALCSDAECHDP